MKNQRRSQIILKFLKKERRKKIPYYIKVLNINRKAERAGIYRPNYFDD